MFRNVGFLAIGIFALVAILGRLLPSDLDVPNVTGDTSIYTDDAFRATVQKLDQEFESHWHLNDLPVAPRADDWTVIRRLSLALTGTVPSLEEIRAIERIPSEGRLQWWIERLLSDRRYSDYVAERLARSYVGTEDGPFLVFRRRRFVTWLSDQLSGKLPYDEIARQLISGTGIWTDSPSVNFLTVTNDVNGDEQPDEERLAARTARAFLGIRLDCVQCHDDNLGGDWLQEDFQRLAAFYADAQSSLLGISDEPTDYSFKYLGNDDAEVVTECVPFLPNLWQNKTGTRREQLAAWLTHPENGAFARAITNRFWAIMFGRPLGSPIDDLPVSGPFPPGLETIAQDFVQHDHDLRRLVRLIAMSRPFQLASRSPDGVSDQQEAAWAAFPLTRLRPEQVAGSILQAASLTTIDAQSHIFKRFAKYDEIQKFVKRYGDTGEDEFANRSETIPQRLLMMNGNLVKERTKDDFFNNSVSRIAALVENSDEAIDATYWTILSRRPSSGERQYFKERIGEQTGKERQKVLEDLAWTLFNATEFLVNH